MAAPGERSARAVLLRTLIACVVLVGAFEWSARAFGWFDPTVMSDPYQGFPGTPPLYRPESRDGRMLYVTSPNKDKYRRTSFGVEKGPNEFRVFCIGSSSTNSDAFTEPDGSYPNFLRIYLSFLMPGKTPVVINAGGGGSSSVQHLEVLREVLGYEPDLIVIAPEAGDKNLIPPSSQGVMAQHDDANPVTTMVRRQITKSQLYIAAREALQKARPAPLVPQGLLSAFSSFFLYTVSQPYSADTFSRLFEFKNDRVPVLMPYVISRDEIDYAHKHFSGRLDEMIGLAREHGVPLLMLGPLRNLKASFYYRFHIDPSEIRDGRVDEWRALYSQAVEAKRVGRPEVAMQLFHKVRELYVLDRDEILAFYIGECLEKLGRYDEAFEEYAKPYRENPSLKLIVDAASSHGVPLADPFPRVRTIAEHGIPGYGEFTDSVHPMTTTNRIVALTVLDTMRDMHLWPTLADEDSPRFTGADKAVQAIIDKCPPPLANLMLRALLAGRPAEAVRLAETITADELLDRLIEPLYYGWALTQLGRDEQAQAIYNRLKKNYLRPGAVIPPLETDEDLVRVAFAGDVFAWF